MNTYERILQQLIDMEIIDTHEHLSPYEATWNPSDIPPRPIVTGVESGQEIFSDETNILNTIINGSYVHNLIHASHKHVDFSGCTTLVEKMRVFRPVWELIRHCGYAQVTRIMLKDLFGVDDITEDNIEELNSKFLATLRPGYFDTYLKQMAKIKVCLLDSDLSCDKRYFRSLYRMDWFIMPVIQEHLWKVEGFTGVHVRSLDDWKEAARVALDKALALGAVGIKSGLAYKRSLRFDRALYHEAEQSFNEMYKMRYYPGWEPQRFGTNTAFENYMMHYVCKLAEERELTIQFHTGIMVGGGNYIDNSNPEHLSNLCIEYPGLKFDLFHIGYPYQNVLASMSSMMPNVYLDMCWAHMISPVASRQILSEWLEAIPHNKILAFGGDLGGGSVQTVYAHAKLARMNVASVLAEKIDSGLMSEDEALFTAQLMFHDTPVELFGLKDI